MRLVTPWVASSARLTVYMFHAFVHFYYNVCVTVTLAFLWIRTGWSPIPLSQIILAYIIL